MNSSNKILITGAAGRIGSALVSYLNEKYDLTLADIHTTEIMKWTEKGHQVVKLDIRDPESCKTACQNIDTVIHLAGVASAEAGFESISKVNMEGTYHMFRAAQKEGCKRMIFASSVQAVEGYPLDVQVKENMEVRPKSLYGVGKCFGEALAAYFAYEENLPSIAIRIGTFDAFYAEKNKTVRNMSTYLSSADFCHLVERCVESHLERPYELVHAVSDNRFKRLDLTRAKETFDFHPQNDGFQECGVRFKF